ncbi:MAG: sigma-70 family RNA polymerase sigma factor, partial [Micromonosporaceae bacterium]|nr:sigma-70 family RNA polymerase sigma factor [Micromonosporaceae bacterium]
TNLQAGKGPDLAFRAYLHTTVRHTFYDRAKAAARTQPVDEVPEPAADPTPADPAVDTEERRLAARAFQTLPERWRQVLWHTEIEGDTPAQVAPLLGLTPNGVAALAYRARERLRQAYLQAHLADRPPVGDCAENTSMLAAEIRGNLSARDHAKVTRHLEGCAACSALHTELTDLNTDLAALIAPAVLGGTWAAYLGVGSTAVKGGVIAAMAGWPAAAVNQARGVWDKLGPRNATIAAGGAAAVLAAVIAAALVSNQAPPPPGAERPPAEQPPTAPPADDPTDEPTEAPTDEPTDEPAEPENPPESPGRTPPPATTPPASPSKKPPQGPPDPLPKPPVTITPGSRNPTLAAGRSSVLPIRVERAAETGTAAESGASSSGQGGGIGVRSLPWRPIVGHKTGERMVLEVRLPDRIWLSSHVAGDGWRCVRADDTARCARRALRPGESTVAELRLVVARTVSGPQRFTATVKLAGLSATESFDVRITGRTVGPHGDHGKGSHAGRPPRTRGSRRAPE